MDWVGQLILTYYPMMQTMFQGHQSCGSCKEGLKGIHYLKIVCEHDQEIPQSQTADNPMALFQFLSLFSLLNVITKFNNFPTYLP